MQSAYSGVTVNSTTGEVTISFTAATGTVYIQANYGLLTAAIPLRLSDYTLNFNYNNSADGCYFINDCEPTVYINAYVTDRKGHRVTWPELVSIVYTSDSGLSNTTGEFTQEELDLYSWDEPTGVTATATFSDGTILQKSVLVYIIRIPPRE
jgi:hypothetical protein